jgi:predicted Zn-dependent peptidase
MIQRFSPLLLPLLLALPHTTNAATASGGAEGGTEAASLQALGRSLQRAQLENGLRVVMNVDNSSPSVAVCVTYDVGARNEQPGRSGFAHLFEHMMFQGSANVKKGEHFTWITSRGGTLNGTTSNDRTNYFEVLPSNGLALALWLEADRMKSLDVSQDNFENQRKVVQEEYRMRVSNAAYATGYMALQELAFGNYFPYAHTAIGKMEDLDAAKLEWIREFHDQYYGPNNAVLSISGDFDPDQAMQLVRQYFGPASKAPVPTYQPPTLEEQTQPRSQQVSDESAHTPGVFLGWVIPPTREPEHYALELATLVLGGGESSRLHQLLVRERSWAQSVSLWTSDHRGPDLFALRVILSEQGKLANVTRALRQQIDELGRQGPSAAELEKAKNQLLSYFLFGLEDNIARARQLGSYELYYGDARLLTRELERYQKVTATQVQQAVAKYLTLARQSQVTVEPTQAPAAAQEKQP